MLCDRKGTYRAFTFALPSAETRKISVHLFNFFEKMKALRLLVPAIFSLLALAACKNDPKTTSTNTASPNVADAPMVSPQKVAYICPMDCEQGKTYDQPGTCPVCKMDLEVAGSDQLRHAAIEIAAAAKNNSLPPDNPNKMLEEEVNTLHDQVMKESSEMERVGRQLKEDFKTVQVDARNPYTLAIAEISRAGFDMMAWMRDYHAPSDMTQEEANKYLKEQKASMLKIRSAVDKALADGKKLHKD